MKIGINLVGVSYNDGNIGRYRNYEDALDGFYTNVVDPLREEGHTVQFYIFSYDNIKKLKQAGISIVGYGSPAKATTALNYFGITNKQIDYIIEDNQLKHNKIVPGVNIPIYPKEKAELNLPDIILVLAWNFFEEVKSNNKKLIDLGVRFVNIKELQNENWN